MDCFNNSPEASTNKNVNNQLKKMYENDKSQAKILLLGAGASGKSTIFKQMKILHMKGYTEKERADKKIIIRNNVAEIFISLITAANTFQYTIDAKHNNIVKSILEHKSQVSYFTLNDRVTAMLKDLWKDDAIKKTLERSTEFDLLDSTEYFIQHLDRIGSADYLPTVDDILRSRVKTVGIVQQEFKTDKMNILMVDVGGQRNERKKWIHAFDCVTSIIFITSLNEFDQKLVEDNTKNRMHESIELFEKIINLKPFAHIAIILFYNKEDLFREKIKNKDLTCCFKDYKGGKDYDKAVGFIKERFNEKNTKSEREIFSHVTTATNTENIKFVFDACTALILKELLKASGYY